MRNPHTTIAPSRPLGGLPPDTSPIPHLPSTNLPYAQESAGRAGGGKVGWWACGGRAWGRRTGRSGPLTALEGHGQPSVHIFIDSAPPAHAVRCCVRVSCSTNFLLHEGMLVVCVRVRRLFSTAPPNSGADKTAPRPWHCPRREVCTVADHYHLRFFPR